MLVFSIGVDAQTVVEERLTAEGFAIAPERTEAPDFTLETLSGEERSLSSYQGINDDRFKIVAVDLQEDRETVKEFTDELDLSFPILLDERGIAGSIYGISAIPTTFLIDKDGGLVARLVGSREWNTIGMLMNE